MKIIYTLCLTGLLFACGDKVVNQAADNPEFDAIADKMAMVAKPNGCWITSKTAAHVLMEARIITSEDPLAIQQEKASKFLGYLVDNNKVVGDDGDKLKLTAGVCG